MSASLRGGTQVVRHFASVAEYKCLILHWPQMIVILSDQMFLENWLNSPYLASVSPFLQIS